MRFLPLFSLTVLSSEFSWQMMHLPASNELSIACLESVTDSMSVYYRLLVEPWKDKISVPLAWSGCYDVKYNKNCFTKELCYKFLLKCNKNCFTDSFHEILWHSNTENIFIWSVLPCIWLFCEIAKYLVFGVGVTFLY